MSTELEEARLLVLECFNQACQTSYRDLGNGEYAITYNHGFISTYEEAQAMLIEWGLVGEGECEVL